MIQSACPSTAVTEKWLFIRKNKPTIDNCSWESWLTKERQILSGHAKWDAYALWPETRTPLLYDTVERIERETASRTNLTNRRQLRKADNNAQTRKYTGKDTCIKSPIERIEGDIWSKFQRPIPCELCRPQVQLVSRVPGSNEVQCCKEVWNHFGVVRKRWNVRNHVRRTDDKGENRNVDLFWKRNGVSHQVSQSRT